MPEFISDTIQVHVVTIDPVTGQSMFLALHRSPENKVYPSVWQAITGRIELNEKSIDAAIRELKEETGLEPVRIWTIPFVTMYFDPYKDLIHASPVFGIEVNSHSKILLSDEHDDYQWLDYDESYDLLELPSHKQGLSHFRDYIIRSVGDSLFNDVDPERYLYKGESK